MGKTEQDWTWEACLYRRNKCALDKLIKPDETSEYLVHGENVGDKTLGKMLNQKVESAYKILKSDINLNIPEHICEAIEWLKKQFLLLPGQVKHIIYVIILTKIKEI